MGLENGSGVVSSIDLHAVCCMVNRMVGLIDEVGELRVYMPRFEWTHLGVPRRRIANHPGQDVVNIHECGRKH